MIFYFNKSHRLTSHRNFATEEAQQAKTEQPVVELTENEKKLTGDVEKLTKEVETLTEKNKELDVNNKRSNSLRDCLLIFTF